MEIIVNVKAGKGNGKKRLDKVTAYLDERGLPYAVHRTKRSEERRVGKECRL